MTIHVEPGHFTRREQAMSEIKSDGLFYVETKVAPSQLTGMPHVHAFSVHIYVLEGIMELHEPDTGLAHMLEAGSKALVPAQTLHWEGTPAGFRAAFGLSVDPATLDPADLVRSPTAP